MPTVYLKMGLSNFLNIYLGQSNRFHKDIFIERCSFMYSDHIYTPHSYSCLSTSSLPVSNTHPTLCVSYTCI